MCTSEVWGEVYECHSCEFVSGEIIEGNEALLNLLKEKRVASKQIRRKPVPVKTVPFKKLVRAPKAQTGMVGSTDLRQIAKEISVPSLPAKHSIPNSSGSIFTPRP